MKTKFRLLGIRFCCFLFSSCRKSESSQKKPWANFGKASGSNDVGNDTRTVKTSEGEGIDEESQHKKSSAQHRFVIKSEIKFTNLSLLSSNARSRCFNARFDSFGEFFLHNFSSLHSLGSLFNHWNWNSFISVVSESEFWFRLQWENKLIMETSATDLKFKSFLETFSSIVCS